MDLHVYRNSQDRWCDLRSASRERGAILSSNAVTLDELVQRLTPDARTATSGQRLAIIHSAIRETGSAVPPGFVRYAFEAVADTKASTVGAGELREAGAEFLAMVLEGYEAGLKKAGLFDPQERRALAASRVIEGKTEWLRRFQRVFLHAIYDLSESEFLLARSLIEVLPDGGVVVLFNSTANVKPTEFAEWTWRRFIQNEAVAEKSIPEFCRGSNPARPVLDRLFSFEAAEPLPLDESIQIIEAQSRYNEAEIICSEIADLIGRGVSPNEIAVVVRNIETYGEMLEDVFSRFGIPCSFGTGVPLLRVPFIKFWFALLDLATGERSREALARVMSSAYFEPRLSPQFDVEKALCAYGYIDRHHLRASVMAARKKSPLATELARLERLLDDLEQAKDAISTFLQRLDKFAPRTDRDRSAWRSLIEELESADGLSGTISFADFRQLASEIASIKTVDRAGARRSPPGVPRVQILGPQLMGYRSFQWIFAPGVADGEFPARASANPLLPDEIVEALNRRSRKRRLMTTRDRARREPLYLFMMIDCASRRCTLTYPANTLEGEPKYPSVYIGEISRHFADPPVNRVHGHLPVRDDGERLRRLADEWRKGSLSKDRARDLLGDDIIERVQWEFLGSSRADMGCNAIPMGGVWHPSELNSLAACPFVFLARHRLRLRAWETPDFEVPVSEVGILAHNILREYYALGSPASYEEAASRMSDIIVRKLSNVDLDGQGPYTVFDPALWKIRRRQLVSVLMEYVKFTVKDALDGFVSLPEYLDAPLPPAPLGDVMVGGRPDHVAVHRTDGRIDGIRVDDFKYSAASSGINKQLKESLQIPVYSHLAAKVLGAEPGIRIEGRYLLLRSPSNPVVVQSIDEIVLEDVRARITNELEKVRRGDLHPNPTEKQDCASCDYRRLCRFHGV